MAFNKIHSIQELNYNIEKGKNKRQNCEDMEEKNNFKNFYFRPHVRTQSTLEIKCL